MTSTNTPIDLRTSGLTLDNETKSHLRAKLSSRLAKLAGQVRRATIRLDDVNGPRGGVDIRCSIKLVVADLPSVVVEGDGVDARRAFETTLGRIERTTRTALERAQRSAGPKRLSRVAARNEVDATQADESAQGMRQEPSSTATRNKKKNTSRAAVALEDSANGKPSRKSTRRGAKQAKADDKLRQRQTARARSPSTRAAKGAARGR